MISRRLGICPEERRGTIKTNSGACPDIVEVLDPGELNLSGTRAMQEEAVHLIVGSLVSEEQIARASLPDDVRIASYEAVVAVPDQVFFHGAVALLRSRGLLQGDIPYTPPLK